MDYFIFFNHLSLPSTSREKAYTLLFESFQGVLGLNRNQHDRFAFYLDFKSAEKTEKSKLFKNFYYHDFKEELKNKNEMDLRSFIEEMEDKAPIWDESHHNEMREVTYIQVENSNSYDKNNLSNYKILLRAFSKGGITLSLATKDIWKDTVIKFKTWSGKAPTRNYEIDNIAKEKHGKIIRNRHIEKRLTNLPNLTFTKKFLAWFKNCNIKDQDKIAYCHENQFQIGRPTIDTLGNSSIRNMKEIRVGDAHGQRGKIRILFMNMKNQETVILLGFIKHSNDYVREIAAAKKLLEDRSWLQ